MIVDKILNSCSEVWSSAGITQVYKMTMDLDVDEIIKTLLASRETGKQVCLILFRLCIQ